MAPKLRTNIDLALYRATLHSEIYLSYFYLWTRIPLAHGHYRQESVILLFIRIGRYLRLLCKAPQLADRDLLV